MAHTFNENVVMDLAEWTSTLSYTWLLHLVDHATKYSASVVIKSKKKETIVEQLVKMLIEIFGHPKKFLVNNGGEFDNDGFRDFYENLKIRIKTTAA